MKNILRLSFVLLVFAIFLLSGCATIFHGTNQEIRVNSEPSGAKVCVVRRIDKGFGGFGSSNIVEALSVKSGRIEGGGCVSTPAVLEFSKSALMLFLNDRVFEFKKEGYKPVAVTLSRKTDSVVWANILELPFMGIGFLVDFATGAWWEYKPTEINIVLEKSSP